MITCSPLFDSFIKQVVRVLRANPSLVTALAAITMGCLIHPALGLFVLLFSHAFCCHSALCRYAVGLKFVFSSHYDGFPTLRT